MKGNFSSLISVIIDELSANCSATSETISCPVGEGTGIHTLNITAGNPECGLVINTTFTYP